MTPQPNRSNSPDEIRLYREALALARAELLRTDPADADRVIAQRQRIQDLKKIISDEDPPSGLAVSA